MEKIVEGLTVVGSLVVFVGLIPILSSIGRKTEVIVNMFQTALPIVVAGLIILGFATALAERG